MKRVITLWVGIIFLVAAFAISGATQQVMADKGQPTSAKEAPPLAVSPTAPTPTQTRTPVPLPTGTAVCQPSWFREDSPSPGQIDNALRGAASSGPNDVWAVGSYLPDTAQGTAYKRAHQPAQWQKELESRGITGKLASESSPRDQLSPAYRTLIEHWNGAGWSVISSPNADSNDNNLYGISTLAANDAWAVGTYLNEFGIAQTLAMHWNGSAWSIVSTPDLTPYEDNELLGVAQVSATNAWAVGYSVDTDAVGHELIMHWDGTAWSVVASPEPPDVYYGDSLSSITAISADDIWAGGMYINEHDSERTLALHWDGTAWSIVSTPNIGLAVSSFYSLDATGTNDVWGVGLYLDDHETYRSLAEHWDGTQWTIVPVPAGEEGGNSSLASIDASSASDAWAVGGYGSYSAPSEPFIVHWDGTAWSIVESVDLGENIYSQLQGVTIAGQADIWGVGNILAEDPSNGITVNTLTEHYGDVLASCSMTFSDVPEGSTFYNAVRYLSCKGILSGYPCGGANEPCDPQNDPYFRPNASINRGQLAKLVSNAAGFNDEANNPFFADVDYGSTYYDYVWRLAARGIIGGYACGGPGEPCYGGNLPYFRPGAPTTRGQIAKIVASAIGYTGQPTTQTFQDVPPSNAFYRYIENLAALGAMSGYPCGGSNGPCVPPLNRPYFKPNNNATRGQTAKIVEQTFFRGCALAR